MGLTLHITSGESPGECLIQSGLSGEVLVWRDVLYDGEREPGWPDRSALAARAQFLSKMTAGGMSIESALQTLESQYLKLERYSGEADLVLWFDACLYDQSMLAHLLHCIAQKNHRSVEIICVADFPGIKPFNGLGQLNCEELLSFYNKRIRVNHEQLEFAGRVDVAFARQDIRILQEIAEMEDTPLSWVPEAAKRWLEEQPDDETGLKKLETLVLEALQNGLQEPIAIFHHVSAADSSPQYWGDITLWAAINNLADRHPPLVQIEGPASRLPQWLPDKKIKQFRIKRI